MERITAVGSGCEMTVSQRRPWAERVKGLKLGTSVDRIGSRLACVGGFLDQGRTAASGNGDHGRYWWVSGQII